MKTITKIRKAKEADKTAAWFAADLDIEQGNQIVREMVLSLPGHYKLYTREYGTNLVDAVYEAYGKIPSLLLTESFMLGMQALYPDKVYAGFTHGLDVVEIKK